MRAPDQAIAAIAAGQYGVFNREQAFAAGAGERFIDRRLADRAWLRLDRSVYGLPQYPATWLRQLKVAELGTRDAAIAGRAGAALHELTGFRPGRPEIMIPLTSRRRSGIAIVHRYAGAATTIVKRIRVTTIAQTLVDLGTMVGPWTLERAMDDAILGGRVSIADLTERVDFYRGARRNGIVVVRALVDERREEGWTPPESELEALAARVLERACSGWRRQYRLPFRGPAGGRVDFALAARLIVEADGRRWHARVADFERDRWRDNEATAAGWRVLRFTWVHLTTSPDAVVDLIRRTIAGAE